MLLFEYSDDKKVHACPCLALFVNEYQMLQYSVQLQMTSGLHVLKMPIDMNSLPQAITSALKLSAVIHTVVS